MSGIIGLLYLDGQQVGRPVLSRMVRAMGHRGPDGTRIWSEDAVGLGHLLLRTTPEGAQDAQPLQETGGNFVVTADVRLDNREELFDLLGFEVHRRASVSDGALLLAAYQKWGVRCPEKLLGAFAFAIWDAQERALFCARDHFGVKPLYYAHRPGRFFAFASEPKALLQLPAVSDALDEVKIAEHLLVPVRPDAARTYYRDVQALVPAHTMHVSARGLQRRTYWALDPEREVRLGSDDEYAEAFRELFVEAVRCRLRTDATVGSMLSGGLDSSSVTCAAAQLLGPNTPLHTFSAVFDSVPASNEREYIQAVLDAYDQLRPHFLMADQVSPLGKYAFASWHADSVDVGANGYIHANLHQTASELGVRVILDGFDGDTTVSHGLLYFRELRDQGRWIKLMREVGTFAERIGQPPRDAIWSWIKGPVLTWSGVALLAKLRNRIRGQQVRSDPPPLWRRAIHNTLWEQVQSEMEEPLEKPATAREEHYRLLRRPLMAGILQHLDAMAAGASLEIRYPFYDKRLIEFCLALPGEQKMQHGWSRYVLRNAMKGILPPAIRRRGDKSNLEYGLNAGWRRYEGRRLQELVSSRDGEAAGFIDGRFFREAYDRFEAHEASEADRLMLWRMMTLSLWLQLRREDSRYHNAPEASPKYAR